jgi:DHA3 family macrolide efflux protein-like MFS transporter
VRRSPNQRIAAFLLAEAISAIGSWGTILVVWGYAAYEYDATPAQVSLVGLSFSLPPVLFGPIAGTVIDRIGPKATLAGAKVLGIISALLLLTANDFGSMAALSAVHGTAMAFSYPALQALPPRLVEDRHLARTNALVGMTDELSIVFGPVVAGVAVAAFGFRGAFIVDALTYGLGLAVLPLVQLRPKVRHPDEAIDPADDPPVRLRDAFEGWKLIRRSDVLRRVVTMTFAVHLLYGAALLSEPLYVRDVLERSPDVFAALQTAFGICMVVGGLVATKVGERMATVRWVGIGVFFSGLSAIVYLGTPWVAVAFLGVALWGIATAVISGPSRTVIQRAAPQRAHGRVLSADLMAGSTGELVGLASAGVLISSFSVPWAILVLGSGIAVAGVLLGRLLHPRTTVAVCAPLDDSGSTPSSAGASRSASPR